MRRNVGAEERLPRSRVRPVAVLVPWRLRDDEPPTLTQSAQPKRIQRELLRRSHRQLTLALRQLVGTRIVLGEDARYIERVFALEEPVPPFRARAGGVFGAFVIFGQQNLQSHGVTQKLLKGHPQSGAQQCDRAQYLQRATFDHPRAFIAQHGLCQRASEKRRLLGRTLTCDTEMPPAE